MSQRARYALRRLCERIGGNVNVPDGHLCEIRIRHEQTVAANQLIKSRVNPVGPTPVVHILQNHLRTGAPDLKHSRIKINATRETNLVHLETDAVLQSHALL